LREDLESFQASVLPSEQNEAETDEDAAVGQQLSRLQNYVRQRAHLTDSFERISASKTSSKFMIPVLSTNNSSGDATFLDELHNHVINEQTPIEMLQQLFNFLKSEEYETDTLKSDIAFNGNGNIALHLNHKQCIHSIAQFIKATAAKESTFSLGFRFYYWPYYKERDALSADEQIIYGHTNNKHDHSGLKVHQLFVSNKYNSFKNEISNYSLLTKVQYENAIAKVKKFMDSEQVRQNRAGYFEEGHGWQQKEGTGFLHYGIEIGAMLQSCHILALVLYTDHSKLCTAFSSSFRKLYAFETLKSVKQRNACYYWMSRHLRELVEIFGHCSNGDWDANNGIFANKLRGPFYCGMNVKLSIPSFAMRLNSPSSTSREITVAMKFSGETGVLLTFDNPSGDSSSSLVNVQYKYLRGWSCAWISRFKEEEEVLFFGGFHRIKLVDLWLIETNEHFRSFVKAIFYLDAMLTGADMADVPKGKRLAKSFRNW